MRIKATVSYDGSKFYGFQIQNKSSHATVAGRLQKALEKLNITTKIVGSGRTDRGVHATSQVVHFEVPSLWEKKLTTLHKALNKNIHPHMHIKILTKAEDTFHARFSATKRLYRYILYAGEFNPFLAPYALHVKPLDLEKLNLVLKSFEGEFDFSYFKKEGSVTHTNTRTIFKTSAYKHKDFYVITFLGNAFLRSQVRMMVSFALKVLDGKLSENDLATQLTCKKISSTSLVDSSGLYLAKIYY